MTAPLRPSIDVRRADERFVTRLTWLESRHSFSFGPHYDPANTHHGLLLVNNEDVVAAGSGFGPHPHREMEIVTWVLQGSLAHQDSAGHSGVLTPGLVQRMSAGTGVVHSETNDAWHLQGGQPHNEPVHLVQMWVVPDESGLRPGYEQRDIDAALRRGGLLPIASGMPKHDGEAAVRIGNRRAALHAARMQSGDRVQLPDAPFLHLFVALGAIDLEGVGTLGAGDAARFTASGGRQVTATASAEILTWEMYARL